MKGKPSVSVGRARHKNAGRSSPAAGCAEPTSTRSRAAAVPTGQRLRILEDRVDNLMALLSDIQYRRTVEQMGLAIASKLMALGDKLDMRRIAKMEALLESDLIMVTRSIKASDNGGKRDSDRRGAKRSRLATEPPQSAGRSAAKASPKPPKSQ